MSIPNSIKLTLLENSHAFLREAVSKALAATEDVHQWQFAILNIVQSLELSLKAALKAIHPVLVYENIDNPRHTVGPMVALQRLGNPRIGGFVVSETDRNRIQRAIKVRNDVTHADFELNGEYAAGKFFEVFAFVSEFQRRYLNTKVSDLISSDEFTRLVQIRKLLDELVKRARLRIEQENISAEFVWACPNCGEDTFVIEDGADTCFACLHTADVVTCSNCSKLTFENEMKSFFEDLDTDYEEGMTIVRNAYGYSNHDACPECLPEIRENIRDQRSREEFEQLEAEYGYRNG